MNYTMDVKPGSNVRIVTEVDLTRERIHVKSSTVYDVNGNFVILAQTDPPVLKSMLQKEVIITYLKHDKNGLVRYGFPATVMEFVDAFKLNETQQARAIVVNRKAAPIPYSIRMFFRVEPTSKSNLVMTINGRDVNVLDISLGGVKFSHGKNFAPRPDSVVEVELTIDGKIHKTEARILRTWEAENERLKNELRLSSAEFQNMTKGLEHELSKKIRQIEVESRLEQVYP